MWNLEYVQLMTIAFFFAGLMIFTEYTKPKPGKKRKRRNKPKSNLLFLPEDELEGIVFGIGRRNKLCCSPASDEGHMICVGGSGMGKQVPC